MTLFIRDLTKLRQKIGLYKNEQAVWITYKDIANSAGNLCLHLIRNLHTYTGTKLGNTGYGRNREEEFAIKNTPVKKLLQKIDETILVIEKTLAPITDEQLQKEYPLLVFENKTSTGYFMVHLATHPGYHPGQVNYHRHLLAN